MSPPTPGMRVPVNCVKYLISMATPAITQVSSSLANFSFNEFTMHLEGFGCLYLPSIVPKLAPEPLIITLSMGGIFLSFNAELLS